MKVGKTLQFATVDEWHDWLEANHATEKELWLILYKRQAASKGLYYNEALDEALYFG